MSENAALLADDVLHGCPIWQCMLHLPMLLRLLLARYPSELSKVMLIIHRIISTHTFSRASLPNKKTKIGQLRLFSDLAAHSI